MFVYSATQKVAALDAVTGKMIDGKQYIVIGTSNGKDRTGPQGAPRSWPSLCRKEQAPDLWWTRDLKVYAG
jgi:hypothetical protein